MLAVPAMMPYVPPWRSYGATQVSAVETLIDHLCRAFEVSVTILCWSNNEYVQKTQYKKNGNETTLHSTLLI